MTDSGCLPEPALWPAVDDQSLSPADTAHLRCCPRCAARVALLRAQRRQFRDLAEPPPVHVPENPPQREARRDPPQHIGRYPIQRLLKLGGESEVYLVRHPTSGEDVVVKWVHLPLSRHPDVARRLVDEVHFLDRLRHPQLVRVLDLGIAEGRPFVVLEYIRGSELCRDGARPRPPRDAVRIIADVARCLQVVHDAGRLHLDVQPANILIDTDGRPRLIDFGLSLPCRSQTAAGTGLRGTPEYMAPEQVAGDAALLTPATDVYALGAVLYELLTGAAPQPELLWATTSAATSDAGAAIPAAVPDALLRLCRRALDPLPSRRFATPLEFAQALERWTDRRRRLMKQIASGAFAAAGLACAAAAIPPPDSYAVGETTIDVRTHAASPGDVLREFLDRSSAARRCVWLILPDGRPVPVNVPCHGPAGGAASELIGDLALELGGIDGTAMLLATDSGPSGTPPSAWNRPELQLPSLPPGTLARITHREIVLLAADSDATETQNRARTLAVPLHRLRGGAMRIAPGCDLLVIAGGAPHRATGP